MKKKSTLDNVTRQPLLKNMSVIGTTLMVSSSILIPGMTTKAYADAIKNQSETVDSQSQEQTSQGKTDSMTINSFETDSIIKENDNRIDMVFDLSARSIENETTSIQISPNINLLADDSKKSVVDETGKIIGNYVVDNQLNKINITFTGSGFTQAKLSVLASVKKFDLSEQVITASIGESMQSKTITVEKAEDHETIEEDTKETSETSSVDDLTNEKNESVDDTADETNKNDVESKQNTSEDIDLKEDTTEIPEIKEDKVNQADKEDSEKDNIEEITTDTDNVTQQTTDSSADSIEDQEVKNSENTTDSNVISNQSTDSEKRETEVKIEDKKDENNVSEVEESSDVESQVESQVEPVTLATMARSTSLLSSKDQFIQDTASYAQEVASENGLYASVMIAQAILESGYGSSTLSCAPNYNLFGIKGSYNGQSVTMQTWEYFNGQNVTINAQFRKYPSYRESFEDNARVIKTTSFSPGNYFYSGAWKANTNSYQDATKWLTGRYATDPNYNTKLNNLILAYNLTQYDTPGAKTETSNNQSSSNTATSGSSSSSPTVINTSTTATDSNSYTVKSGDTLYAIGSSYGVTVAQLKSLNNLTSDTIYVGQKLTLSGTKKVNNTVTTNTSNNSNKTPETATANNTNSKMTKDIDYTIKSGDTLYGIGRQYGVSVSQLKTWNNLSSDIIYVGQTLKLNTSKNIATTTKTATTISSSTASEYTVKSGDTLYGIGRQYGISVSQLKTWNNLSSDIIYVNQRLSINRQATTAEATQTKTSNNKGLNTSSSNSTYTVKSGDTLYRIALDNHVSVSDLKSWNNMKSDLIGIGQKLIIKKGSNTTVVNASLSSQATTNYIVKSGDSLYQIALKHGTSVNELKQLNHLSGDMIYVGQTLKIKNSNSATTTQTTVKKTARHSVTSGDSLWALANKYGTSVSKIKQLNNLSSDVIYIGQNLNVG